MNWQVGDVAICITPGSDIFDMEVEVRGPLELCSVSGTGELVLAHLIDPGVPSTAPAGWGAEPQHLKPLPPANEVTEWNDCIFQPQELVVVNG